MGLLDILKITLEVVEDQHADKNLTPKQHSHSMALAANQTIPNRSRQIM